jgi:peptidoglycan/LPS O-acetylase OafA/YrhL
MSPDRVPELDWLRFGAASAVLVYHNTYRIPANGVPSEDVFPIVQMFSRFGYLGVNLFFLISGFVILWSAGSKSVRQFAASRALRLYPTFWAAMLLTLAVVLLLEPSGRLPTTGTFFANLTMVPGLAGREAIDGVYWTLVAEIKFYLLLAILIATRQIARIETWLWLWTGLLALCAIGVDIPGLRSLTLFPFGSLFAGGCWAYLIRSRGASGTRHLGLAASMVLAVIAVGGQAEEFIHDASNQDVLYSRVIVAACFVVVYAVSRGWWKTRYAGIAVALGALTYPLYLVHNRIGKAIFASTEGALPIGLRIVLITVVAFALAVLLTKLVEGRLVRRIGRSRTYRELAGLGGN